jgi:predicted metal-dependent hydrolase
MTQTITAAGELLAVIQGDDRLAPYITQVRVSARRKTFGMSITPGEEGATVAVPESMADRPDFVLKVLRGNIHRLVAMVVKAREHAPDTSARELVNGEGFLWLGRSRRLRLVDDAAVPLRLVNDGHGGWLHLDRQAAKLGTRPFIDWYVKEGAAWLAQNTTGMWSRVGGAAEAPVIRAADIGARRWGTYDGRRHEVRIAWQTFQLPPNMIRHVLTHELVHASRPGGKPHGPEFWRRFECAWPGCREDMRRLNETGRSVWMGDLSA